MSGNLDEKLTDKSETIIKTDINAKPIKQIVFTQPKQSPPDPWYCLCCLFCFEACNWWSASVQSVQYNAHNKRQSHKNYWGHNVTSGDDEDNDDAIIGDDFDCGSVFANQIIGAKDHCKDNDDHNDDCGGDGGDGGGGDGGGGGD